MFPIRKRKTYTKSGGSSQKYSRTNEEYSIMPYARRAFINKRRAPYKRRTKYNERSSAGGLFKPKGSIPAIKARNWEWLTVKMSHTGQNQEFISAKLIADEAQLQLGNSCQAQRIMVSSVQAWNIAGVTPTTSNPTLNLKCRSQQHGAPADTTVAEGKDEGTLQSPASVGYKWSAVEAATIHSVDNQNSPIIYTVTPGNGQTCLSHVKIKMYSNV